MRTRRMQQQDGGTLIVVLIFIALVGLVLSGLMSESSANVAFTTTVKDHQSKVYAADAGVQFGIQQLRQNNTLCPRTGVSGPPIANISVNDVNVGVTCSVNSGSTSGSEGYAVITRSPNADSLVLSNAHQKKIEGYVYVTGGVSWGPGLNVKRGDFIQQKQGSSCLTPPGSSDLTMERPPYDNYCYSTSEFPVPNPPHMAPPVPTVTNPGGTRTDPQGTWAMGVDNGTCRVFSPGIYTFRPDLRTGDNYFISGVYYFDFNDSTDSKNVIEVKLATIYGGQPSAAEQAEQRFPTPADCTGHDPANSGTGVEFVFGRKARMLIDTQGQVELFGRQTTDTASTETRNFSFVAVPTSDTTNWPSASWAPSTVASGTPVLEIKDGEQQDLAIHGVVYAPDQGIVLTATNSVLAQTMSGIVAYTVELKSSASAQGLAVSIAPGTPSPRLILITATAVGTPGQKAVRSSAVVGVANNAAKTITIKSWRTRGVSDPL